MIKPFFSTRLLPAALLTFSIFLLLMVLLRTAWTSDAPAAADSAPSNSDQTKTSHPSLDPILFADWPAPKTALVVTGLLEGYIEPCGCSGKENMQGGLSRRDMLLQQLAAKKWPTVPIDLGDQVRRFGRQQEIKFQDAADALKVMGYRAIALGPDDLRLSATEVFAAVAPVDKAVSPFVSANAAFAFAPTDLV